MAAPVSRTSNASVARSSHIAAGRWSVNGSSEIQPRVSNPIRDYLRPTDVFPVSQYNDDAASASGERCRRVQIEQFQREKPAGFAGEQRRWIQDGLPDHRRRHRRRRTHGPARGSIPRPRGPRRIPPGSQRVVAIRRLRDGIGHTDGDLRRTEPVLALVPDSRKSPVSR